VAPEPSLASDRQGAGTLAEAWELVLESQNDLPKGVLPFLKAASADFSLEGTIRLTIPAGPAMERLGELATIRALKGALSNLGHESVEIVLAEERPSEQRAPRITQETVREGRLEELMEKEPALGEAVRELDLELLD
jgi:hypothetical protein